MIPKIIVNRLEIYFWNAIIPLMQNSDPVRFLVPKAYAVTTQLLDFSTFFMISLGIILGFLFGFCLGLLSQFIA